MCSAFKKSKDTCWEQPARKCRNGNAGLAPGTSHCSHRKTVMVISIMSWQSPAHFWSCPAFGDITGMLGLPPWAALSFMWQRHAWCPHRVDAAVAWMQPTILGRLFLQRWPCFLTSCVPKSSYSQEPWDVFETEKQQTATWSLHGGGIAWAADGVPVCAVNIGLHGPA